jgi:hypothetical protein
MLDGRGERMTSASEQQTRKSVWGNWLRLYSNADQRPVPEPARIGLVRFGGENKRIRPKKPARLRARRGRLITHGLAAEPGQVKWEMSGK